MTPGLLQKLSEYVRHCNPQPTSIIVSPSMWQMAFDKITEHNEHLRFPREQFPYLRAEDVPDGEMKIRGIPIYRGEKLEFIRESVPV